MSIEERVEMIVEDPIVRLQAQINDMGNVIRILQQEAEKHHQERHDYRRFPDTGEHVPKL